jgi:hypothetical protein
VSYPKPTVYEMARRARRLVDERWPEVEALARSLTQHERLGRMSIERIAKDAMPRGLNCWRSPRFF